MNCVNSSCVIYWTKTITVGPSV